ncbi:hypothetical protein V5799_034195 [Amblyomma americanum]|uniref:Mitochondrial ribonuclease P catalytic subunit n=1 Tax=Amblyomma americanum TaxID=6943 RepID=A0AAQ4DL55_AMBAM
MAAAWRRCFARLASGACGRTPLPAVERAEKLYAEVASYAEGRPLSPKDWACFEEQNNPGKRPPFRSELMRCLVVKRDYALAQSLLEYAEGVGGGVTRTLLAYYLALCSTEHQAATCLRRILESSGGLLDARTRDLVVRSLCETPLWRKAIELLDEPAPSSDALNAVAVAALKHGDYSTAWRSVEQLRGSPPLHIHHSTLEAWLMTACTLAQNKQPDQGRWLVDRLLAYLGGSDQGPLSSSLALGLSSFYDKWALPGWSNAPAEISRDGCCCRCGRQLELYQLSSAEWEELRQGVLERCLEGDDPYLSSNPQELNRFRDFLNRAPAYTVVLDGLNVALMGGGTPRLKAQQLLKVVQHYAVQRNKAVLVVGRKHMLQWPANIMDRIWKHCLRYLANDTSHDDPFLLYAALHGGPGTLVVSRDLMRQHRFRLGDPRLQELFRRWRHLHQEQWGTNAPIPAVSYKVEVQGSSTDGWHVPHTEENGTAVATPSPSAPVQWLCIAPATTLQSSS